MQLGSRRTVLAHVVPMTLLLLAGPVLARRHPGALEAAAWLGITAIAYAGLAVVLTEAFRSARERSGFESFLWIGRWEYRQALAALGVRRLPGSPDAARRWLAENPSAAGRSAFRIEALVWTSEFAAATALVEGLPEDTPWQRFHKELHRGFVGFVATGSQTLDAARHAASELNGVERIRADALIAVEDSRQRIAVGDREWIAPLVEVRPRIGAAADRMVLRDWVPKLFRANLVVGVGFGLLAFVLGGVIERARL